MNKLMNMNKLQWVCHHAHLDKSRTINKYRLNQSLRHMKEKWFLMKEIKEQYDGCELYGRMSTTVHKLVKQGCRNIRTFIDVDSTVGIKCILVAREVKRYWKGKGVDIQIGTQPLEGLETKENIDLFLEACNYVDFIGCLPSRDSVPENHLEIVFDTASLLGKDVEAHLDQCNIPTEKETEMFCDYVEKYGYKGKARSIHSISLACQDLKYQEEIAERLADLKIGVIVCPSAAISMTQHSEYTAPIHNSIAPVQTLVKYGVDIGLGIDNVEDIFMPFCDGSLEFELRLLAESTRIYHTDILVDIATNNMGFER